MYLNDNTAHKDDRNRYPVIPVSLNRLQNLNAYIGQICPDNDPAKPSQMITKVTAKPNPFSTTITLDVTCDQSRHIIVRMFDEDGKIVKMFSWYLVRGTNVTAIQELRNVSTGFYLLDFIDHEGNVLFSTKLTKE